MITPAQLEARKERGRELAKKVRITRFKDGWKSPSQNGSGFYYVRSNAETTVHMIKSKFGDSVKSKTWTAQLNEVLCKVVCHNICVVIQEMFELGIQPNFNFCVESQQAVYKVEA